MHLVVGAAVLGLTVGVAVLVSFGAALMALLTSGLPVAVLAGGDRHFYGPRQQD